MGARKQVHGFHGWERVIITPGTFGRILMNYMVPGARHWALQRICKMYRPTISTEFVLRELGFDVDNEFDFGKEWLASCGIVLDSDGKNLLTKNSAVRESDLNDKASSLI